MSVQLLHISFDFKGSVDKDALKKFVGEVEMVDHPSGGTNKVVKAYCNSDVWLDVEEKHRVNMISQ